MKTGVQPRPGRFGRRRSAGFTIVELWISMAVGVVTLGAAGVVYLEVAKQHRSGLSDAVLGHSVDNLQDRLVGLLQTMSATEGATLGTVSTNSKMYRLAVVSTGAGQPQQRVYFDPSLSAVVHDPNKNVSGDEVVLWKSEANSVVLKDLYFTLGLKEGYRPDGSLLNITLELNDDMASRRRSGTSYAVTTYKRAFSVRFRGP